MGLFERSSKHSDQRAAEDAAVGKTVHNATHADKIYGALAAGTVDRLGVQAVVVTPKDAKQPQDMKSVRLVLRDVPPEARNQNKRTVVHINPQYAGENPATVLVKPANCCDTFDPTSEKRIPAEQTERRQRLFAFLQQKFSGDN